MAIASNTQRTTSGRSIGRAPRFATALLVVLFILLRPVCDAFAAYGDLHASDANQQAYAQASDAAGTGHTNDEICCSSVDAGALAVPAAAPLPLTWTGDLAAISLAIRPALAPAARFATRVVQRDPSPPRPYHARSLRRLD